MDGDDAVQDPVIMVEEEHQVSDELLAPFFLEKIDNLPESPRPYIGLRRR